MSAAYENLDEQSERIPVGDGFSVAFTFKAQQLTMDWAPRIPNGRQARRVLLAYRAARDEFVRHLSAKAGVNIGVLEL